MKIVLLNFIYVIMYVFMYYLRQIGSAYWAVVEKKKILKLMYIVLLYTR